MSDIDDLRTQFRRCASILLDPDSGYGKLHDTVQTLYTALSNAVGLDDAHPGEEESHTTWLPLGKAVSVQTAARCLREHLRSARFLRGVEAAVREAQRRFPGERIRLLEAGCGPFGLLALPLATRFTPDELGFVLLDYHTRSLEVVRQLTALLDLTPYLIDTVQADATHWQCPPSLRPHVLVSETMKESLQDEPQAAIVANLAPQIMPDGIMVPESIRVDAGLFRQSDPLDGATRSWIELGPLLDLTQENAAEAYPVNELTIPDPVPEKHQLVTRTSIGLFGDIRLEPYECSLTLDVPVRELRWPQGGERLVAQYALEPQPGFRWQIRRGDNG